MVDIEFNKIQEIRGYLLKSSAHFGGAKFTRMMRDLTNEEKIELFNDDILKRLERVTDYESISSVFRAVPALIQELMWNSINIQKILLGIGTTSDQELRQIIINKKFFSMQELSKKDKKGKFYYNPTKLRALEVLLRYVKSPSIIEQLYYNQYFHMIVLCGKKVPEATISVINEYIQNKNDIRKLVLAYNNKKG